MTEENGSDQPKPPTPPDAPSGDEGTEGTRAAPEPAPEPAPRAAPHAPKDEPPRDEPRGAPKERPKGELRNALAGLLLAAGALGFLGWNEHRTVDREMALSARLDSAHVVRGGNVDAALEGELVLVRAPLFGSGPLRDAKIPYEAKVLRLRRTVQMYQWEARTESREETGPDGQTRTVESESYRRVWSEQPIDSSDFEVKTHKNPEFPFESHVYGAEAPRIGDHRIPAELIGSVDSWEPVPAEDHVAGRANVGRPVYAKGEYYFVGDDPNAPQVGDLRVAHQIVPEGIEASAIGEQRGHALTAFAFRDEHIEPSLLIGEHDAHALYQSGPSSSKPLVWAGRAGGLVLACLAFLLMLGLLSLAREREDVLGDLAHANVALTSLVLGLAASLAVAGSVWIAGGLPVAGGALLALGVLVLGLGGKLRLDAGKKRRARAR